MLVRFDDLRARTAVELRDPTEVWRADTLAEVREVVRTAERAALDGSWVAGFLTYEAGAAYDGSFPRRPEQAGDLPLAWFGAFTAAHAVQPADELDGPAVSGDIHRAHGSRWFRSAVATVRDQIAAGNVYQVNVSDRFVGGLDADPFDLYLAMARTQRGSCHAFVDLGDICIVSASPELFLEWDGDVIACRPMKGTARRAARPDDDLAARDRLAGSLKDRAENVMIVDLVRNDLSRVARLGTVRVPSLFDVERYETVWQLTSTVTAGTRPGVTLDDVLAATYPSGSVTGAPKRAAMQLIRRLEPAPRGIHCGAIGLLSPPRDSGGVHARFSVAIRTAVVDRASSTVAYGAGAGITWSSDPIAEDAEVDAKVEVLRSSWPPFRLLETMRLDASGARNVELHLDRMESSAQWFGYRFDRDAVAKTIAELGARRQAHRLRVVLDRVGSVAVELAPFIEGPTPVRLAIATAAVRSDDPFCVYKTTNRGHYDAACGERPDADDVVLVNERGEVVETTIANLVYRRDGRWWTPPLSSGGLAGIGRRLLIEEGAVSERVLLASELGECEEFAVVNSARGWRQAVLL